MKMLDHPHIMPLFESCSKRGRSYLVMPLIDGGDLFNYIRPAEGLPVPKVRRWFAQVVSAVDYMHSQGFVHLDIKPDNILVCSEGGIILTDFGQSREFIPGKKALRATYGTKTYTPPEAAYRAALQHWIEAPQAFEAANIRSESPSVNPLCEGPELDVWALGCTLYVMLTGCFPFLSSETVDLVGDIVFDTPSFNSVPEEAQELVRGMMTKDPSKRMTMEEVKQFPFVAESLVEVERSISGLCAAPVGQEVPCDQSDHMDCEEGTRARSQSWSKLVQRFGESSTRSGSSGARPGGSVPMMSIGSEIGSTSSRPSIFKPQALLQWVRHQV